LDSVFTALFAATVVSSAETFLAGVTANFANPVSSDDFFWRLTSIFDFSTDDFELDD
jgi:hypothetical protein